MMTLTEADATIYELLRRSPLLWEAFEGAIFTADTRSQDHRGVALVVQTIAITHGTTPQYATTTANVFVPDLEVTIGGKRQRVADLERLGRLSRLVLEAVDSSREAGYLVRIGGESRFEIRETHQHCISLRLEWNIQD